MANWIRQKKQSVKAQILKNTQISRKNNAKNFDSYKNKGATECKNDKSFQVTAKEACVAERKLTKAICKNQTKGTVF